jgi:ATP-dependent DNA helicase RecG
MMTPKEIEEIIQSGEGYTIEWKRSVNPDLAKEMVAFANSSGGRIFIGIDDEGNITGVKITNELRSQVVNQIGLTQQNPKSSKVFNYI